MITRNGAAYLPEQLASIAGQTRLPDEVVICDDASTDSTIELCRRFADGAPFTIRILANEASLGASQNRARSIAACRGSMIALADQDDVWHPTKLERMEDALLQAEGATLVCSDAVLVDARRRPLGAGLWQSIGFDDRRRARVAQGHAFDELLDGNFVSGTAAVCCASLLPAALPVPPAVRADAWLGLIAAATSDVVAMPERLVEYRQSPEQQIGAGVQWRERLRRGLINAVPLQIRARMERRSPLEARLRRLEALRTRLLELEGTAHAPRTRCVAEVTDRIAHWQRRSTLPRHRWDRWPAIRAELTTGRYGRYSHGVRSAAADLAFPVGRRRVQA